MKKQLLQTIDFIVYIYRYAFFFRSVNGEMTRKQMIRKQNDDDLV